MAYTLSNMYAKNMRKRTLLVQLIVKNVVTCLLQHSVVIKRQYCFTQGFNMRVLSHRRFKTISSAVAERPRALNVTVYFANSPKITQGHST